MGYDGDSTLAIPLVYVYIDHTGVFHVNNPFSPFTVGWGNNNKFCGPLGWPCESIN
jgi:hypothetical protein